MSCPAIILAGRRPDVAWRTALVAAIVLLPALLLALLVSALRPDAGGPQPSPVPLPPPVEKR